MNIFYENKVVLPQSSKHDSPQAHSGFPIVAFVGYQRFKSFLCETQYLFPESNSIEKLQLSICKGTFFCPEILAPGTIANQTPQLDLAK